MQLIDALGLYPEIFLIPPTIPSAPDVDPRTALAAVSILHTLLSTASAPAQPAPLSLPPLHTALLSALSAAGASDTARLYLAAALTPYANLTYTDRKGKTLPLCEAVIRDGLKLGTQSHYLDGIPPLFAAAVLLHNPDSSQGRVALGV
jgi:tRNA nucleotidyltransferase (CCA-adding enzyme)